MKAKTTMGIQLFNLTKRMRAMFDDLLASPNLETGEIPAEVAAALEAVELHSEAEILDAACAVKELEAIDEAFAKEADRIKARRATLDRQANHLRSMIERHVTPGTKLSDERVQIGWRKSTAVAVSCDVEDLPKRYTRIKIEPDRTAIGAALKAGKTIDGCAIEERQNMQIK